MLLHLVCFKYKADVDAETRRQHRERLAALKNIDGIEDLKVGADVVRFGAIVPTPAWRLRFVDRAALDAYQKHERHVPVAQFGAGLCDHIVAVDFEIP